MAAFTESDWTYWWQLTTNPASVPATMPDGGESLFPPDFIIDEANGKNWQADMDELFSRYADTGDLCVTAHPFGANTLAHGIKRIVTTPGSRYLAIAAGIPSISSAVGTSVRLYCESALGDQQQKSAVYPTADGWVVVYPMEEAAGTFYDWASNAYDGTDIVSASGKTGQVGNGQQFEQSTWDRIVMPDVSSKFVNDATLMLWVKRHLNTPVAGVETGLLRYDDFDDHYPWTDGKMYLATFRNNRQTITGGIDRSNWHLLSVTQTPGANNWKVYQNSTELFNTTGAASVINPWSGGQIGGYGSYWFDGYLDEFSLANVARSADWITTTYNCQGDNDTFWTVGARQSVAAGGGPIIGSGIIGSSVIGSGIIVPVPDWRW